MLTLLARFRNSGGFFFRESSRSSSLCNAYESCQVALAALHDLAKCFLPSWPPGRSVSVCRTCEQLSPGPAVGRDGVLATTSEVHSNVQEVLRYVQLYYCPVQLTKKCLASAVAFILKKYLKDFFPHTLLNMFFSFIICVVLTIISGLLGERTVAY